MDLFFENVTIDLMAMNTRIPFTGMEIECGKKQWLVNDIKEEIQGIEITRQGKARYDEYFDKRVDPMNRIYYWMSGTKIDIDIEEGIDETAVRQKKISITPVRYQELTNYEMLEELKQWSIQK